MRILASTLLAAVLLPNGAYAQAIIVSPGYPVMPYRGNGFMSPYAHIMPVAPGAWPFSGSVASGPYPPGAQTCVAADLTCPASAPNTVGNRCTCPGRDGRPSFGTVH